MLTQRWVLLPLLILFGASAAVPAQQPAPPPPSPSASADPNAKLCTVSGTVVSANTGEPLRRAHIVLDRDDEDDARDIEGLSDSAGHFEIANIPSGRYDLYAYREGYRQSTFAGAVTSLKPGQKMADVNFKLWKLGVISGRVVDFNGDPVQHVEVTAVVRKQGQNKTANTYKNSATTDDRGEYRIFDLQPGRYLLGASPEETRSISTVQDAPMAEFRQTFYPQTTDASRATLIDVKSGDEISGMDLMMVPAGEIRTFTIHGRVIDNSGAKDSSFIVVMLVPKGAPVLGFHDRRFAEADRKTGAFEVRDVAPGDYTLLASIESQAGQFRARHDVTVVESDPDAVTIVLTKGASIPVRLNREGQEAVAAKNVRIELVPWDPPSDSFYRDFYVEPRPDGTFFAEGVNDDTYTVSIRSTCSECYVKAVDANGVDALARGVQVTGGAGPARIDVTYSSESGRLSGVVHSKDDAPATGATVVIISALPHGEHRTAQTDQYGHYEVKGLPPGDYNAYAFAHFESEMLDDADAMQPYADRRESVSVTANATRTLDLKVIPEAEAQN